MNKKAPQNGENAGRPVISRLEVMAVAGAVAIGLLLALERALTPGARAVPALLFLLLAASAFNLILVWLGRHYLSASAIVWAGRLGNLALLTLAAFWTGGVVSPFFALYALYLVAASLRPGWWGTAIALGLCVMAWAALLLAAPPQSVQGWVYAGSSAGVFVLLAVTVGALAQHHRDTEREWERHDRQLEFLREAGRQLGTSLNPQQVLEATLIQVNELMDVEAASLALVDRATGRITFDLVIGGANESLEGMRLESGQGIVGQVIQHNRPLLVPDAAADPRFSGEVDQFTGFRTRSLLCVPLCVEGQPIGALEVVNKRGGTFTEQDMRLLGSLADLAGPAIENARLHEQVRHNAQNLQTAYDEVRRLNELKSTFIRNISHELRTPLALMQGYVELLLDEQMGPLSPEQRQSLRIVADRTLGLSRMVNDFISLQTVGDLGFDLEVLNLVSVAEEAVEAARPRAERAWIRLELDLLRKDEVPPIRGDVQRLRRVFDHLLDNAIKFSPNGGIVRVSMVCDGAMVVTRIEDQGIGLATEQLERVFERFYQVDSSATRRFGGTGLGLAFVKEVVEAHGGVVLAESEGSVGRGSRFSFYLPIYDTAARETVPSQ